jgi:hypothetical protein
MGQELSPAVRRFQEIKARERTRAIAHNRAIEKVKAANPALTDRQAEQILEAQKRLKARTERSIYVRNHKGKGQRAVKVVTK